MTKVTDPERGQLTITLETRLEVTRGARWARDLARREGHHDEDPDSPAAFLLSLAVRHGIDLDHPKMMDTIDGERPVLDREPLEQPELIAGRDAEFLANAIDHARTSEDEVDRMLAREFGGTMVRATYPEAPRLVAA